MVNDERRVKEDASKHGLSVTPICALLGKDTFKVRISSLDKREHIRIHVPPPLDRQDGTFLVRYRLYGTAQEGLKVEVHHRDAAVAKSPYTIQGLPPD